MAQFIVLCSQTDHLQRFRSRISTQQHHIQQQPSMINTSFNGNQQVDSNMTTGLLKISNLPPDLTREKQH